MGVLPRALEVLIEELGRLPGVGPRTAERYAYHLLRAEPQASHKIAEALSNIHDGVKQCPRTFMLINADQEVSSLYEDPHRNKQVIAVVENPLDVVALEKTGEFSGVYHVLGGAISPIDGIGPEQLTIQPLLKRIKEDNATEVILATNASVEGESTALYIQRQIEESPLKVVVSRLARGLPVGIDLEYADQITLTRALEGRQAI